jgi:hypothetical protein
MADTEAPSKSKAEKVSVTMSDGSTVEFNKKQKLVKTSDPETGSVRLDFVNGEVRHFTIPEALRGRFAVHGAEQKLGDAIAGENDINDAVLAVDDLIGRLNNGEWTAQRAAGSFAGTSILLQALVEVSGKTPAEVRDFLSTKNQGEKIALRRSDKLRPTIEKLEAEKAKNSKSAVDTDALLGDLGIGGSAKKAKSE